MPSIPASDVLVRRTLRGAALLVTTSVLLCSGSGWGQDGTRRDPVLAETLFQEAARLMDRGDYVGACPKLSESQSLDPAPGTLLRLALCHEAIGKTATAWAEFEQALAWAKRDRREDRIALAQEHILALKRTLSTLTVVVPAEVAVLPGLLVQRNDVSIGPAAFGVAAPVDPGTHRIRVTATDYEPTEVQVVVSANADHQTVRVPSLRRRPPAAGSTGPATAAPTRAVPSTGSGELPRPARSEADRAAEAGFSHRTLGYGLSAFGAVSLNVGLYYGLRAIALADRAHDLCPEDPCGSRDGVKASEDASQLAWIADVALAAGLVGVGTGAYFLFIQPRLDASDRSEGLPEKRFVGGATVVAQGTF